MGSPSAPTTVPSTGTGLLADERGTVSGTCSSRVPHPQVQPGDAHTWRACTRSS